MQHNIISTFESCIASLQLKLSDFISGISTFKEGIISRLSDTKKRNINEFSELALHVGNRFELKNPICPACGSTKVIRQEYYPRTHDIFKPIQKIIQDFDRLTLFMRDRLVSKTNPLENYYRNTIPDSLKRIFKSPDGVLNYLKTGRQYWIGHISKIFNTTGFYTHS